MGKQDLELKVVVGLGKTGLSCIRFLVQQGFNVAVTDSREHPPGLDDVRRNYPHIPILIGDFHEDLLDKASEIIVSPGVSLKEPALAKQILAGKPVLGDIELFSRYVNAPVVAITGSNGKSTVTSLFGHLARNAGINVKVGGNLGIPALDLLSERVELYVLELSSFQLESTFTLQTKAAVNLNISPDHMDRYDTLEDYQNAKLRIYRGCQNPVINLDDLNSFSRFIFDVPTTGFRLQTPVNKEFGIHQNETGKYLAYGDQLLLPLKNVPLRGQHQVANVLAALALGTVIGLPMEAMLQAVQTFQGLPHRCQWVANIDEVDYYNDSKATNVGATLAAVLGLGAEINGKIVLLVGGQGKNADFKDLYAPIERYVRSLILYGEDKDLLNKDLQGAAPILTANNFEEAILTAKQRAEPGDVVLLAPACASFDMFRNFEHRGEVFMEIVRGLKK